MTTARFQGTRLRATLFRRSVGGLLAVMTLLGGPILGDRATVFPWVGAARADVVVEPRGERPPRKLDGSVRVPLDLQRRAPVPNAPNVHARIVIPRAVLERALQAPQQVPQQMPWMTDGPSAPVSRTPPGGTVVAGVLLALALASLPWVLRGRPAVAKWGTAAVTLVFILGGWSWAYGDVLFPGFGKKPPRPEPLPVVVRFIQIEIAEQGEEKVSLFVKP